MQSITRPGASSSRVAAAMAMCTGCIACGLIAMRTTRARSVAARTTAAEVAGSRRKRWLET